MSMALARTATAKSALALPTRGSRVASRSCYQLPQQQQQQQQQRSSHSFSHRAPGQLATESGRGKLPLAGRGLEALPGRRNGGLGGSRCFSSTLPSRDENEGRGSVKANEPLHSRFGKWVDVELFKTAKEPVRKLVDWPEGLIETVESEEFSMDRVGDELWALTLRPDQAGQVSGTIQGPQYHTKRAGAEAALDLMVCHLALREQEPGQEDKMAWAKKEGKRPRLNVLWRSSLNGNMHVRLVDYDYYGEHERDDGPGHWSFLGAEVRGTKSGATDRPAVISFNIFRRPLQDAKTVHERAEKAMAESKASAADGGGVGHWQIAVRHKNHKNGPSYTWRPTPKTETGGA